MKRIEKLYNKYFNNVIDKVALGFVLIYGISVIVLGIMLMTGTDTFLRSVVNRVAESMKGYIVCLGGVIPAIRCYQVIFKKNTLEDIVPKNYKQRFLEMYKVYAGMFFIVMGILFIHTLLISSINTESDNIGVMILEYVGANIEGMTMIASSVLLGIYTIAFSVFVSVKKSKSILKIVIVIGIYTLYSKSHGLLEVLFNDGVRSAYMLNYIYVYLISIIIRLALSVILMKYILNNINNINVNKITI